VTPVEESEALHAKVRDFARRALRGESRDGEFDGLSLELAAFQARRNPGIRRLVEARGGFGNREADIPAVPTDAFRMTRVAVHGPELDKACFVTSGTTGAAPGKHAMRVTTTYRELSLAWGARALASAWPGPRVVVALAPPPGPAVPASSSLGFMMRAFMEEWDGRWLDEPPASTKPFDVLSPERWLLGPDGVDVAGLRRAARVALDRSEPFVVLATGFALVLLLDALAGDVVVAPERTVVMPTGGFKGRTREVAPGELARDVARAFRIPRAQIVFEYGMTELTSQLYEGTLPGGALSGEPGVYLPPPWLRISPVDPETLRPVSHGEAGLARFVDLGNVDSAVAVVTQDLVRRCGAGIELLGRRSGAPPRGCSLAVEEIVLGGAGS